MAYGIGWDHKIRKQNRNRIENTTDTFSEPSPPSYSYNRLNKNTDSNTTAILPPHFDTFIQTQRNSASNEYVGANDIVSVKFYQNTNHHGNTDGKYNND